MMYFQIQNTPERVRARKKEIKRDEEVKEECPKLTLAPFSKHPQVVFDNVPIGTTCEKILEVENPTKNMQEITLGRALPPGLVIDLPGDYLEVEPETCYSLTMTWTPTQPTALRETIRFTNSNRGRYDVIVVLKSSMNMKTKNNRPKTKISPGKVTKKINKKSPVAVKKRAEVIIKELKTVNVEQTIHHKVIDQINKKTVSYNNSINANYKKCPFDSLTSLDGFNTTEIFSTVQRETKQDAFHQTYDKSPIILSNQKMYDQKNILKPSNKQISDTSASDIFDNLTFTPLKSLPSKNDKLDKGPNIILSVNSESDFDDSLDLKNDNKENETHSIICITSSQPPNRWVTVNHMQHDNIQYTETPTIPNKKIPNTSSPKDFNSPNFSINTDFSRISDLSFCPQRFSTERKILPKLNNETHELIDNSNIKLNSDTYTKDSFALFDHDANQMYSEPKLWPKELPLKMCRQSLFKEVHREISEKKYTAPSEQILWHNDFRNYMKSPPRSITPPLMSIPEESVQCHDTQDFDNSNKGRETFTINRTYDENYDRSSISVNRNSGWAKKAVRAEPELWKMPTPLPKKTVKPKTSIRSKDSLTGKANHTIDSSKNFNQNSLLYHVENVYSQSYTVDPFSSSTYFYDEEAVNKFETEFKKWLNYILTPPVDLDSNIEQKIDVGKAWIENRNKEIPAAPTKEQVSSVYHNNQRLESLRRFARTLLFSPEISQVLMKLNLQIDKKLIAIRTDRNLHLDVGLQKIIMEILLSYNPLWLRIGLEAIYGLVIPLRSNSDIEGITTFIIQRMFKNPHLKNKHSKSSAPNMLLPAYMEALKKFTLKKFFMLVLFLDQAKQKKLISHDPCLFCRNAICKESREVIIRFTRELIAGIGDITRHLRPLGYVVFHKQTYLDEYKYAVHNIAVDIKDGVRLTKVMEIILMKNGLLSQLRTPAISRLQKIHNVQVALNALKESNFVIVGDISAADIADGHREKTLSLLWQLIHVFRAPLFEKAANVIQTWWKKKYEVIVEKRKEEEKILAERNNASAVIQCWWRRIQYNRKIEHQMVQITCATTIIQKYCRMWICRHRLRRMKRSAVKIAEWYKNVKEIHKAKEILQTLRLRKEQLRQKSATVIQANVRRWLTMTQYKTYRTKIILIQSVVRRYLATKSYLKLLKTVVHIQQRYRSKLLMRKEKKMFEEKRKSATIIQSYYKMFKQRRYFKRLKKAVHTVEQRYKALLLMTSERDKYLELKQTTIRIQSLYRCKLIRRDYVQKRNCIIYLQRRIRATQAMKKDKINYLKLRSSVIIIQRHFKSYLVMKQTRTKYVALRNSVVTIQRYYRSYLEMKRERINYILLRRYTIITQRRYRSLLQMRSDRTAYLNLKKSSLVIQSRYRAFISMRSCKERYQELRNAIVMIQRRYRAVKKMRAVRSEYMKMKSSCKTIQMAYRAYIQGRRQRQVYLKQKEATIKIQNWYRRTKILQKERDMLKKIITVQSFVRMHICRKRFIAIRAAAICIQSYYRFYKLTRTEREKYISFRSSLIKLQAHVRGFVERRRYVRLRSAVLIVQAIYRLKRHRILLNKQREEAATTVQKYVRRHLIQSRYKRYIKQVKLIQTLWRTKLVTRLIRCEFLQKRRLITKLQAVIRGYLVRKEVEHKKETLLKLREERRRHLAASRIQALYRGYKVRLASEARVKEFRRRWRDGALESYEATLHERNEDALAVLRGNDYDYEIWIRAFRSLELLTEVLPMMYNHNASSVVRRVYLYISTTNRSISSVEVLKPAASLLVNLTRYRNTGPKIYRRDRIPPILKFMLRLTSDPQLICIFATYLWLFSKYDEIKQDLTEYLHMPENYKILVTIQKNITRAKRMSNNIVKNKFNTRKSIRSMNYMPSLEPDYGVTRDDRPRYFEDPEQAITCLFDTYNL